MSDINLKGVAGVIMLLAGLATCLAALIFVIVLALFGAHRHPQGFRGRFARVGVGPLAAFLAAVLAVAWAFVASNDAIDDATPYLLVAIAVVGVGAGVMARRRRSTE